MVHTNHKTEILAKLNAAIVRCWNAGSEVAAEGLAREDENGHGMAMWIIDTSHKRSYWKVRDVQTVR
jgi:hypothetical protein